MFKNVVLGWTWRRVLEIGGAVGTVGGFLFQLYAQLSPTQQEVVGRIFSAGYGKLTIDELKLLAIPLGGMLWGYIWSFRSTTKPHAVDDGKIVAKKDLPPTTREAIEVSVGAAEPKPRPKLGGLLDWLRK